MTCSRGWPEVSDGRGAETLGQQALQTRLRRASKDLRRDSGTEVLSLRMPRAGSAHRTREGRRRWLSACGQALRGSLKVECGVSGCHTAHALYSLRCHDDSVYNGVAKDDSCAMILWTRELDVRAAQARLYSRDAHHRLSIGAVEKNVGEGTRPRSERRWSRA